MRESNSQTPYTRIIEHKHFEKGNSSPVTWISREYPVDYKETGEPYYPVNDSVNTRLYAAYRALAEQEGILIGGRLAQYAYFDMDKTVKEALSLAARAIH